MTYTQNDWIKALTKIMELTSLGSLQWNLTNDYGDDAYDTVERAFEAVNGQNRYVIKQVRYRHYYDEEAWSWSTAIRFEIYQRLSSLSDYQRVAAAPELPILGSLYETVESHFAKARGVLDDLL